MTTLSRFEDKYVVCPTGCWVWMGHIRADGYGWFYKDGRAKLAHRAAYELLVGAVPAALELDHLCRMRHCVNPAHLEAVTRLENVRRGEGGKHNIVKTHCPRGHPYDEANTYPIPSGGRGCRACRNRESRDWKAAR